MGHKKPKNRKIYGLQGHKVVTVVTHGRDLTKKWLQQSSTRCFTVCDRDDSRSRPHRNLTQNKFTVVTMVTNGFYFTKSHLALLIFFASRS